MSEELAHRPPAADAKPELVERGWTPGEEPTLELALELFLAGRNQRTVKAYGADLRLWACWAKPQGTVRQAVSELLQGSAGAAHAQVRAYQMHLKARGLAHATINRRLAALRSLVALAQSLGLVVWSLRVRSLKVEGMRDTRGPGVPAVQRLFRAAATQRPPKAARDLALLRVLYDLALRRSEVIAIQVGDIDLERSALWVLRKGKDQKILLSLPETTRTALAACLEARGAAPGALFLSFDRAGDGARALTGDGLYAVIQSLARKAKIDRTRPHGLRHTAITTAMEEAGRLGIPIEEVLAYSGHAKGSLPLLLAYRDRIRDRQGEIAGLVAGGAKS
jgi:integrase/recombinase XerC